MQNKMTGKDLLTELKHLNSELIVAYNTVEKLLVYSRDNDPRMWRELNRMNEFGDTFIGKKLPARIAAAKQRLKEYEQLEEEK